MHHVVHTLVDAAPDAIQLSVGQANILQRAITEATAMTPDAARELVRSLTGNLEDMTQSLDTLVAGSTMTAQSVTASFAEVARVNVDQALLFLQDLAAAKDPSEALSIQTDYLTQQFQQFSKQIYEMNNTLVRLMTLSAIPVQTEITKTLQRIQAT